MVIQKSNLLLVVILIVVFLVAGGWYWYSQKNQDGEIACPQDAKICPDGSAVARTGPNCEFAECPNEVVGSTGSTNAGNTETANWKMYRNEEYGFELKYPSNWDFNDVQQVGVPYGFIIHPHINDFDGRYSHLSILPGFCQGVLNTVPKKVTINEIAMDRYDYGESTITPIFHFAGNVNNGWDLVCNTIQIDSETDPDLYSKFVQILFTFKFTK